MLIFLNARANDGEGLRKWERVKGELERKYFRGGYTLISDFASFPERLAAELRKGERLLVAAGGDGTVSLLVNQIMRLDPDERRGLILGAIGLGSSNDFHKPYSRTSWLNGSIPARLDFEHAAPHNVGRVDFEDEVGNPQRKYFIVNCSLGLTAQANRLFNEEDRVVRRLKPKWVAGTIYYAALKTILTSPDVPAGVVVAAECFKTDVTSLSVLINPHLSGNLSYDLDVTPQSGFFGIALCERMGTLARIKTLLSLVRGKFQGLPRTQCWREESIKIAPDSSTPLELDGEVFLARQIRIELLKGCLKVSP